MGNFGYILGYLIFFIFGIGFLCGMIYEMWRNKNENNN